MRSARFTAELDPSATRGERIGLRARVARRWRMRAPRVRIASEMRAPAPARRATRASALCALALAAALLPSCAAKRVLRITSVPPGAEVRVDHQLVGTSPLDFDFKAYGTRRISLFHEGYATSTTILPIRPPWYARFPVDILTEVVFPIGWRDRRRLHVQLVPGTDKAARLDLRSVLERAEAMRHAGPSGPRSLPTLSNEANTAEDAPRDPSAPGAPPTPPASAPTSSPQSGLAP